MCEEVVWHVSEDEHDEKRQSHIPERFPTRPPFSLASPVLSTPPHPAFYPPANVCVRVPAVFSQSDASALQCNLWPKSCFVGANQLDILLIAGAEMSLHLQLFS